MGGIAQRMSRGLFVVGRPKLVHLAHAVPSVKKNTAWRLPPSLTISGIAQSAPSTSLIWPLAAPLFHGCFMASIWCRQLQQHLPLPVMPSRLQSIAIFFPSPRSTAAQQANQAGLVTAAPRQAPYWQRWASGASGGVYLGDGLPPEVSQHRVHALRRKPTRASRN
jgi:hypothetical protein